MFAQIAGFNPNCLVGRKIMRWRWREKIFFIPQRNKKFINNNGGRTMSDGWRITAEKNKKPGPENKEACFISSTSFSWWLMCIKNKLSQSWRIKRNFSHSSPLSFTARFPFAIRLPFFVLAEHSFTVRFELFKYERSFWWRGKKFLNKKVSYEIWWGAFVNLV